ncbi:geranylgeranylglycerol-phosphate geranylgeranyltransferase [Haloferax mediterranei ATCC 33500]|uniref:Digeranylgeranylglyceryl phosphate synthase n=1 Tax=Haloferax mediterranei (strain ATCC 33500 / DSM 1411 / JCM 8866 / NBRC 14739 / NCIMB 2177 / R-4) TaxID=523841 RepID=I3R4P8_HALMT|nr:geranylgeranylglycerol-phosphate geranylgeranyltransferase [Haloferax mediterranei]AFK19208.1 prenyltransferase / 4-hydroxybenzoate octaprenyltransferase [Haloferax mediterranei ATCC 33500]AHZ21430.1 prenyltransferase [Haloferax mediterranei ATCC 33500]EMA03888.1 prenyltransferase [Haloferax mediterranei ATCC 33500]MDX5989309.1 geranylgeranylglycerol-phosphate geranylgeranyltransferase [Haloferax mediterranei ATCC 33500]QCQ75676.1 geranylgeranylglycerol-phosphate geranylgeranyltransferase [
MSLGARARGFVELTRPGNAIAAGVLTFTGAFVAGASLGDTLVVVAAILATVFATGAGNAVNDYFDRDIDRINRPDRPIPRGAVTAAEAKWFSIALFGGAVVSALVLPLVAIGIAVVNLVALLAYTEFFKGLPGVGNIVVAALTGSTFLFGGAAIGKPLGALVLCLLAALATLTREIVKDVEDIAGDKKEGLRTLPIVVGEQTSLWLGVGVLVVAIAASAVPFIRGAFGLAYLGLVVPADVVMLVAAARSFEHPGVAQRRLKHGMFLAAFAFIVGRASSLAGVTL